MKKLFLLFAVVCLVATGFAQDRAYGNLTASASDCSTTPSSGVAVLAIPTSDTGSASIDLGGTFTATISFKVSSDGGTTFRAISGVPVGGGAAVTSATSGGNWRFSVGGYTHICAYVSAYTSGTANVVIHSGRVSAGLSGGGYTSGGVTADVVPESDGAGGLRDSPIITDNSVGFRVVEGAAPSGVASSDILYADSTAHRWKFNANNGGAGTLAAFTDKLSVFAATTSSELAGVISDETGTLKFVLSDAPTFTTSVTSPAYISATASPGSAGIVRLASGDTVCFRNNANGADACLGKTGALSGVMPADTLDISGFGGLKFNATSSGSALLPSTNTGIYLDANGTLGPFLKATGVIVPNAALYAWATNTDPTSAVVTNISSASSGVAQVGTTAANSAGTLSAATFQYRGLAQTYFVTGDFTTSGSGTALELITGLSWTFAANIAMNVKVDCFLDYNQNVAAVAVAFGFQDATIAPTNLAGWARMGTNTTVFTAGTLAASTTTTATAVVSATPSAITTIWPAELHLFIEQPSNASTSVFSIRVSTATAGDTVTIKRGSYCTLQQ